MNDQTFPQQAQELEPMKEVEDHYIRAEILLPGGNEMARGHVVSQSCDANGNMMGRAHMNPILVTKTYQVEFIQGNVTELTTNFIAESMYAQCDADRNQYFLLYALVAYLKDNNAISLTEQQMSIWGRPVTSKTTACWKICCQWKDGSNSQKKLSELKESHPVQTAEFAVVQGIDHAPAFNWWVKHVLNKRNRIMVSIRQQQSRCHGTP